MILIGDNVKLKDNGRLNNAYTVISVIPEINQPSRLTLKCIDGSIINTYENNVSKIIK